LIEETNKCREHFSVEVKAPGLLIIDTPGHESFSNLRSRGSGLCDFAILVIDLMHGIEKQTLESIELLRDRKTPFVIALNKIDRCYGWKTLPFDSSYKSLQQQAKPTINEFNEKLGTVTTELQLNRINSNLYWKNQDIKSHVSVVPTSGVTGEGIPDLLSVIMKYTSIFMKKKMQVKEDEFNCTIMEVKMIEGHGTTIDCILIDGVLHKGDEIMIMGFEGPVKTKIRALLTPHPMKEMRVKNEYESHEVIYAAMGLKISAPNLDSAVAGSAIYLVESEENEERARAQIEKDLNEVKSKVELQLMGVGVAASTLGSLEALLLFLKQSEIPVSHVSVGPVSKDDVTKAMKAALADDPNKRKKEFSCMLVFDVKVLADAQQYAETNGVKIFCANIIYHLFKMFTDYVAQVREQRKKDEGKAAVFPCILKPVAFFNKKDPIIIGVDVERGVLKIGTPLCVYDESVSVYCF